MKRVTAQCPGSCGELIQGWVGDSQKLVSYGINRFSQITVQNKASEFMENSTNIVDFNINKTIPNTLNQIQFVTKKMTIDTIKVIPVLDNVASNKDNITHLSNNSYSKIGQAFILTGKHLNLSANQMLQVELVQHSQLSVAKGMASSTADIAATCLATAAYFGKKMTLSEILTICTTIEATDTTPIPMLTLWNQNTGGKIQYSGWKPKFFVLVLEPKFQVATDCFHTSATDYAFYQQRNQFAEAYQLYQQAINEKSLTKLGMAATKSAILNQEILPKPAFDQLLQLTSELNLLGINVAHSGTLVGLLLQHSEQGKFAIKRLLELGIDKDYPHIYLQQVCFSGVTLVDKIISSEVR